MHNNYVELGRTVWVGVVQFCGKLQSTLNSINTAIYFILTFSLTFAEFLAKGGNICNEPVNEMNVLTFSAYNARINVSYSPACTHHFVY